MLFAIGSANIDFCLTMRGKNCVATILFSMQWRSRPLHG
ncbi:hypothetical protein CAter282_0792 [Collimonas arenae]|uniref:Uncharacterized protein n=1 Tax=Collimonas arenae TaxID=279058 RepID=A0A127QFJ2_9BURK|nr:hypothetical protein CAter10_0863 [Collimonas arenae]AMP08595.1 hypothetical protein CAter282_0792 [Collimonas arenae]